MLINYFPPAFVLAVSPRAHINGIIQESRFYQLTLRKDRETGEFSVLMEEDVDQFNLLPDGTKGLQLKGRGVESYPVLLHGDNDSAVDPTTGQVLLNRDLTGEESVLDFRQRVHADPRPMELQGNWLEQLMMNGPVNILAMRTHHVRMADADPYNKFSQ